MVMSVLGVFFKFLRNLLQALCRDIRSLFLIIKIESKLRRTEKNDLIVADMFRKLVRKHPDKTCISYYDTNWSYLDLENYSNKVANLFSEKFNLKKGDCVALFLENKPEYVGIWLGLSKIGVISALINTNLKKAPLVHSINVVEPKVLIYDSSLESSIDDVRSEIKEGVKFLVDDANNKKSQKDIVLSDLLTKASNAVLITNEKLSTKDVIMYVFTSGTTGLPKPAVIKQNRYLAGGFTFFDSAYLTQNDIIYITLPIYHAVGGVIGVGSALVSGSTIVLRKKFSASNFWKECIQYNCTVFMYVGEICRFLVNQPVSPLDRQHTIRKAIGNGLRTNVWKEFYQRFNVKCIEFYAASEGNCTMINTVSKIGACGFVPLVNSLIKILPIYVIKIDDEMNPIRNNKGFCIECARGEKGLLIGMINPKSAKTAYNGYANNSSASNKKIIQNVFKKGQNAFNSGDLMMCDSFGYMYFCDRLGDTYRWRGENVATIEVENVISKHLNSTEVVVYGVEVPGQEGRAGMVAIVNNSSISINLNKLAQHLKTELALYAVPIFVRFVENLEHTGTFKAKKNVLVEESYNINLFKDKCFYLDTKDYAYKELTTQVYQSIQNGNLRF